MRVNDPSKVFFIPEGFVAASVFSTLRYGGKTSIDQLISLCQTEETIDASIESAISTIESDWDLLKAETKTELKNIIQTYGFQNRLKKALELTEDDLEAV